MSLLNLQANKMPPKNAIFDDSRQEQGKIGIFEIALYAF